MSGPFGWEEFGEYFDEEPSATDILIHPITEPTVVNSPIVENLDVNVPFIAATTTVYSPTVVDASQARTSQAPVEVAVEPTDQQARTTQAPVEVAVENNPPVRISSEPVEVLVHPTNAPVRVSGVPVEVLVKPTDAPVRVSSIPVEVLRSLNKVTLRIDPATASVEMPDVGLVVEQFLPVDPATATVEMSDTVTVLEYTVSVYNAPVEAVAPTLEYTFTVDTGDADAPIGGDVGVSFTYSGQAEADVEMPDVGLSINPNVNLTWSAATATVAMSDVGITIDDGTEPTPTPSPGVGPQIIADTGEELFGLLTLRVNPATCHVAMVPPALKYYRSRQSRFQKLFRPIFPEKPCAYGMLATPTVTLKVGPPPNHHLLTVRPQHRLDFAVDSMSVQFTDRSSALWGDIRRDVPRETQALLDLGVSRSLISDTIPTVRRLKRRS